MRLFIAEKPDLAKAIAAGLGGGFAFKDGYFEKGNDIVTWCYGHMLQLLDPRDYDSKYRDWSMDDLPFLFLPAKYKLNPKTAKQTKVIERLLGKADTVVNAGDPDEEGQLLVDELLRFFGNKKPVERVLINDNNTKVVAKAIANLRPNSEYEHLGFKAEARSIADQAFGYNLTRAYTLNTQATGGQGTISIGRVQTPILGLIVRRDREHKAHEKSYYYDVMGQFDVGISRFEAKYQPKPSDTLDDQGRLKDKAQADAIVASCKGKPAKVIDSSTKEKRQPPILPYNLLKLQQDASRKFGLKPDKTLAITQALREKHQLITYNRSDCQYLSDEQHADAPAVFSAIRRTAPILANTVDGADSAIKGRVFNSAKVSAHHAIVPTEKVADLDKLSEAEKSIYLIIARAYLAQFYDDYVFDSTIIELEVDGLAFVARAKVDKQLGWKSLYTKDDGNEETQDEDDTISVDLRKIKEGADGKCASCENRQKETSPPPLYTMTSLLGDLTRVSKYVKNPVLAKILKEKDKDKAGEHGGIGTPATRSSIIQTLFDRGFIAEHKKKIISTELGQKLYDTLDDLVRYPDMTAKWHDQQQSIKTKGDVERFVNQVMADVIEPEVARLKTTQLKVVSTHDCPKCQRPMRRVNGQYGWFWGCSGYKEEANPCNHMMDDKNGKPVEKKAKPKPKTTEFECKACGSKLIHRTGKSKKTKKPYSFFGCSNYPKCEKSYDEKGGKPVYD